MTVAAERLRSFVERIERLDTEQQTVGLDKKSVYDEAKKAGVNTKMLRRYIAERKRDAKDSQTDKDALDAMRAALGEAGATYRSAAAKLGMTKSKLHRLVPNRGNGTNEIPTSAKNAHVAAHDPDTGEITNKEVASSGGDAGRPSEPSEPAEQSVNVAPPPERVSLGLSVGEGPHPGNESTESCGGGSQSPGHVGLTAGKLHGAGGAKGTCPESPSVGVAPDPQDLTIPPFLRRSAA